MSVVEKIQLIIWDYISFSLDNIKKSFFFIIFLLSSSKLFVMRIDTRFSVAPAKTVRPKTRKHYEKCNIPIGISLHLISFPWSYVAVRQAPLYKNL